jgi:glycolate oxidase iron-sulfur subunit
MKETLGSLRSALGEQSSYDAASQCSRCGYCLEDCPTYLATGQESFSGRGRNQIVRMLLEGKISKPEDAEEALSTCLLCGACTAACYARIPTADIVLEGRRMLPGNPSLPAVILTKLLARHPALFRKLLKIAYALKRSGLPRLLRPLLGLLGLGALAEAESAVPEPPRNFLRETLALPPDAGKPGWIYFAACGPDYLFPEIGLATVSLLDRGKGPGAFLRNGCCGLFSYNYGRIEDARFLARRNIEALERSGGEANLVVDCSSCASFLKSYPGLFPPDSPWRSRAERFQSRVRDILEILPDLELSGEDAARKPAPIVYHESCRARNGEGLAPPSALLRRMAGESFRGLPESDVCCGGAGLFAFRHPDLSDAILRRKIAHIAESGAEIVLTSSTSCLVQLARGLSKYYPQARVMHLSIYAAEASARTHGSQTGS